MEFRLAWSPAARFDLIDLRTFIAQDNPRAAKRFTNDIIDSVERLARFPTSGRVVPEFADPSLREIIRPPCRVVYRVNSKEKRIDIVRVWYAARGIPGISPRM